MNKNQNKKRGNLGSQGQNFNAGEGRRAGQQPKSANKSNRSSSSASRGSGDIDTDE